MRTIMKRLFSLAVLCFLIAVPAVALPGQNGKPNPDSRPDKMEMDQTMMATEAHHHDEMGPHMKMTTVRPIRAGDDERAGAIVQTARRVLEKYKDYKTAL